LIGKHLFAYGRVVVDLFKARADPTRPAVVDDLVDRDGQTLFELCDRLASNHQLGTTRQALITTADRAATSLSDYNRRREFDVNRQTGHHMDRLTSIRNEEAQPRSRP
jgi:hypothetical protein